MELDEIEQRFCSNIPSLLDSGRNEKKAQRVFSDFSISTPNSNISGYNAQLFPPNPVKYETELA